MELRYNSSHYLTLSHPLLGSGLRNYLKLLYKNGFRIDPRMSLKLLASFATVLFWTPLRLLESLLLNRKIKKTEVKKPIIILGHPRSGTTYLHYLLAADPQLSFSNTYQVFMPRIFYFFGKYIGKMMDPMMPKKRAMDNLSMGAFKPTMDEFALANLGEASLCHGFYFPRNLQKYFDRYVTFKNGSERERAAYKKSQLYFAKKMQLRYPGKRLILKGPATTARIKELLDIFPDARFMHIYRNPYEIYLSNERLYEKILPLFGFHKTTAEDVEDYIINSYRDYHQKWLDEKSLIPRDRLVEFGFEDFVNDPLPHLQHAYETLDIHLSVKAQEAFEQVAAQHSNYKQNKYTSLPLELKQRIAKEWSFCFKEWGYPM